MIQYLHTEVAKDTQHSHTEIDDEDAWYCSKNSYDI